MASGSRRSLKVTDNQHLHDLQTTARCPRQGSRLQESPKVMWEREEQTFAVIWVHSEIRKKPQNIIILMVGCPKPIPNLRNFLCGNVV